MVPKRRAKCVEGRIVKLSAMQRAIWLTLLGVASCGFLQGCEVAPEVAAPESGQISIGMNPDDLSAGWTLSGPAGIKRTGVGSALLNGMPVGSYTLLWNPVPGYASPTPNPVTLSLTANSRRELFGNYNTIVALTGTIRVTPAPSALQAPWSINGPDGFVAASAGAVEYSGRAVGDYTITWGPVNGYYAPGPQTLTLTAAAPIDFNWSYVIATSSTGTLQLNPEPNSLSAGWLVVSTSGSPGYRGSGDATLSPIPSGTYDLYWTGVDSWYPPAQNPQRFTLGSGQSLTLTGNYSETPPGTGSTTGDIQIAPVPSGLGADWTITGPNGFSTSGSGTRSLTEMPVGSYTLSWQAESGYQSPSPSQSTKSLTADATISFVGIYTDLNGPAISGLSGSTSDGSNVSLSGSSFGSHAMDVEWMGGSNGRIESLATGTRADGWGQGWRIGVSSSATPAQISTARAHSGNRSIRAYVDYDISNSYNSGFAFEPGQAFDEIYVSWWVYFRPISEDGSCGSYGPQWKMWRLNATADWNASMNNFLGEIMSSGNYRVGQGRDNLYTMLWCANVGAWDCAKSEPCFPYGYPNGTLSEQWHTSGQTGVAMPNDANKWVRWELYVKASSAPDVKDGSYIYRCIIPGQNTWAVEWENNICTHRDLNSTPGVTGWMQWTRFIWQNYWGNCGDDAEWFFDDIYVQLGNHARVELGDAPQWQDCRHREVQDVTSWSSSSIQVRLNKGSLPSGQAYLYVVRDDGVVSNAQPVTLQ